MASAISSIWGKKPNQNLALPPEELLSMKRFFTPTRNFSHNTLEPAGIQNQYDDNFYQTNANVISGTKSKDQSRLNIGDFWRQQRQSLAEQGGSKNNSRIQLPKIRSMTLNTSYRFIQKIKESGSGTVLKQGDEQISSQPSLTSQLKKIKPQGSGYTLGKAVPSTYNIDKLAKASYEVDEPIKEIQDENFFTKYGKKFGMQLAQSSPILQGDRHYSSANLLAFGGPAKREKIINYSIDNTAKCICFCEQRMGEKSSCIHSKSEDVDVISEIICDQAREFLVADRHTSDDISLVQIGLDKVEFVRSKHYLAKLAILVSRQEKEILKLQNNKKGKYNNFLKFLQEFKQIKKENQLLKEQVSSLSNELKMIRDNEITSFIRDKSQLSTMIHFKDQESQILLNKINEEIERNKNLQERVFVQEMEIKTLLNCVEGLRHQIIQNQYQDGAQKYAEKYSKLLELYASSEKIVNKIKMERDTEIEKDLFDLAMKRITTEAELDIINIDFKNLLQQKTQWKQNDGS